MLQLPQKPILYLITRGATTESTDATSVEFQSVLSQVSAAVIAGIQLIQLREKQLTARVLFELTRSVLEITRGTSTRVLVNDRADIAAGAGANGVHLTTNSLEPKIIRQSFGEEFLIGASTHSLEEAVAAREGGADFAVFGPVFETSSKTRYGPPVGLDKLSETCWALDPFSILALGGISKDNAVQCLHAGASGVAGIGMFANPSTLRATVAAIYSKYEEVES